MDKSQRIKRIKMQSYWHMNLWRLNITIGINGLNPCSYQIERIKFVIDYDHKNRKLWEIFMPIFGFLLYRKTDYRGAMISKLYFGISLLKWNFSNRDLFKEREGK